MNERGAGSVLAVAVLGGIVAMTATCLPFYSAMSAKQSAAGAADAAALAAADARAGLAPEAPCELAALVAIANDSRLDACVVDGLVVTVRVTRTFAGLSLFGQATAGPGDSGHD